MKMGMCADGRRLTYDAQAYEFQLGGRPATLDDVRALDSRGLINWESPKLRAWFASIDRDALAACNRAARSQAASAPVFRFEVREEFKSKGGKLGKEKTFKLPKLLNEGARYEKAGGSDCITVSATGKVTVEKGAKRGSHAVEVEVRGPSRASRPLAVGVVTAVIR